MLVKSEGIIFRTTKYGETSVVAEIFSPDYGLNSYIIGSVRKKKSKLASIVQVLNIVEFVSYYKDNSSLSRIKEIQLHLVYNDFPFNVVKSSLGLFLTEICQKALRKIDQPGEVYHFIKRTFLALDQSTESLAHFHITFLIDLSSYLGFGLTNNYDPSAPYFNLQNGVFCGVYEDPKYDLGRETSESLHWYLSGQNHASINRDQRKRVLAALIDFFRYHIEDFGQIRSLDVIYSLYE